MHAASREALEIISEYFDTTSKNKGKPVAVAAQTGVELFDVVEFLDGDWVLHITNLGLVQPRNRRLRHEPQSRQRNGEGNA